MNVLFNFRTLPTVCFCAALLVSLTSCGEQAPPLEKFYAAPEFALENHLGETVSTDTLMGKVWIADFFFTTCPAICPMLTAQFEAVQASIQNQGLADQVRLVSFSLDPQRDTPETLAEYAELHEVQAGLWHLLTGDKDTIWSLSNQGFKLAVDPIADDPMNPISHSGKFVLVDHAGMIRGYYDGLDPKSVEQLQTDIERLVQDID
jgi:protein SCO1/2